MTLRVFSGIQPTGVPHLGNYLGALAGWATLQRKAAAVTPRPGVLYCVVDLHAMTMPYEPRALDTSCRQTAAALLACGIDPGAGAIVFRQSAVREHAELCWLLACVTPLGWLSRMTQYKQKAGAARDASSLGLLSYPVLQTADILLYRATHVPVGEDQHQHLELARDIAAMFNRRFGDDGASTVPPTGANGGAHGSASPRITGVAGSAAAVVSLDEALRAGAAPPSLNSGSGGARFFPLPVTVTVGAAGGGGARVMSLRDASRKMSKSDPDDSSRINLTDSADVIAAKVRRAKTDSAHGFAAGAALSPEKSNLLEIFGAVAGCGAAAAAARFADASAAAFKEELTAALVAKVVPIGDEMRRLLRDGGAGRGGGAVDDALARGAERAREIAAGVMRDVRAAVGAAP